MEESKIKDWFDQPVPKEIEKKVEREIQLVEFVSNLTKEEKLRVLQLILNN